MNIRVFTIPIHDGARTQEELNSFLQTHRIAEVRTEFLSAGLHSAWTFCVITSTEIQSSPKKRSQRVDYREILNEEQFQKYAELRSLRKEIAEREGVPVYTVFTNEQLAEMVKQQVTSTTEFSSISGIGSARVQKYADEFVPVLVRQQESGKSHSITKAEDETSTD